MGNHRTNTQQLGIIGGNGWLGNAIASRAVACGVMSGENILVSGRSERPGRLPVPGVRFTRDNAQLARESDVIMLSVRPEHFAALEIDAGGRLVISVMAGVTVADIAARTGASAIIRSIPNAAAAIGQSFTPWCTTEAVTEADRAFVNTLFTACGESAEISLEAHVEDCAGLTGSGAAFPALLAEAMIAWARSRGMPDDFARRAARGVVAGASRLLEAGEADPAAIVQEMIDYNGTTAAALRTMRAQGFDAAVMAGLSAATERSMAMQEALRK